MMRIGIYGGTFSPPHYGHIQSALAFMEQMWLDFLYVIPTAVPPHKENDDSISAEDRLKMTELAFAGVEGVYVSDMEILRGGKSYTVDTLRTLYGEDRRLFLLCGTDMMLTLDQWKNPDEIFKLCYPTYVRRENDVIIEKQIISKIAQYQKDYGKVVRRIITEPIQISSSMIRSRIEVNLPIEGLVPPLVEKYIREHHLYEAKNEN